MANAIDAGSTYTPELTRNLASNPTYQAYQILHVAFTAAPILAGADKFLNLLTNWEKYLAPVFPRTLGIAPLTFMNAVGIIEVIAGLVVAFKPKIGAYIVCIWLFGIILNLLLVHGFYDIALRDFGLALAALSLGCLSQGFDK